MKRFCVVCVLVLATSASYAVTTLTGRWKIHQDVSGNVSDQMCTFDQKEDAITGTCKTAEGKTLDVTGSVEGKKVMWKYNTDYEGTALTVTMSTTLTDSDTISGTVDVQPYDVSGDFTGSMVTVAAEDGKHP